MGGFSIQLIESILSGHLGKLFEVIVRTEKDEDDISLGLKT